MADVSGSGDVWAGFAAPPPSSCPETASRSSFSDAGGFVRAVLVWINKPQVVNRRLCGSCLLHYRRGLSRPSPAGLRETTVPPALLAPGSSSDNNNRHPPACARGDLGIEDFPLSDSGPPAAAVVAIRDLLPRQHQKHPILREAIIYERSKLTFMFCPISIINKNGELSPVDQVIYGFQYQVGSPSRIRLRLGELPADDSKSSMSRAWLERELLVKVTRWSEESSLCTESTSLKLVPVDRYNHCYSHLKQKYANDLIQKWPEKTDPQKYVFEDIAIAAYLLLLWEEERKELDLDKKQSFVDLGCGNGLLVYILESEGHPGLGIDVRKRKIWDIYGLGTKLKEQPITPSAENLFPDYDWILGNHSDELTPWIPVIAARSSYHSRYFVLPCCHYDFDSKFSKRVSGTSQHRMYLDFIKEVGHKCGFIVKEDTLRIPSTKKICFIGRERNYSQSQEKDVNQSLTSYIEKRCVRSRKLAENHDRSLVGSKEMLVDSWSVGFKVRACQRTLGACKNIPDEEKKKNIHIVVCKLLSLETREICTLSDGRKWNKGEGAITTKLQRLGFKNYTPSMHLKRWSQFRTHLLKCHRDVFKWEFMDTNSLVYLLGKLPLADVVQLISKDTLKLLKSECGGLQTLLRNFSSVFQVSGGVVQLRDFTQSNPWSKTSKVQNTSSKKNYYKTSLCWFHKHHPDGCPRSANVCSFAHSEAELQTIKKGTHNMDKLNDKELQTTN